MPALAGEKCSTVDSSPIQTMGDSPHPDTGPDTSLGYLFDSESEELSMTSITPDNKPRTKESCQSAIHDAIKDQKAGHAHGLMRFLKPCTHEELHAQLTKVEAKLDKGWQQAQEYQEIADQRRKIVVREENKKRQQKHRQQQRDDEIARGEQSPGGTKQNLKVHSYLVRYLSI